jgi:hypothetical protein
MLETTQVLLGAGDEGRPRATEAIAGQGAHHVRSPLQTGLSYCCHTVVVVFYVHSDKKREKEFYISLVAHNLVAHN